MKETRNMSNAEIVVRLGARFKTYRLAARMTQEEVAQQSGVAIATIRRFENGQLVNPNMQTVLALLRAIDQMDGIDGLLPEMPTNPALIYKQKNEPKRVKHSNK